MIKPQVHVRCPRCGWQGKRVDRGGEHPWGRCSRCQASLQRRSNEGRDAKGHWLKGAKLPTSHRFPKGKRTSPATEFKPGEPSWNSSEVGEPCWWESESCWVTVTEEKIPARTRGKPYKRRKRVSYARWLWEKHHGKLPKGAIVWVRHQSLQHLPTLDDIEIIDRAELMRRNSRRAPKKKG